MGETCVGADSFSKFPLCSAERCAFPANVHDILRQNEYALEPNLNPDSFIAILDVSGLGERRPVGDLSRIRRMLAEASVIITARTEGRLVGVARALTDRAFCVYLSDLAVDPAWQGRGIGHELIRRVHAEAGEALTDLILLAAPQAEKPTIRISVFADSRTVSSSNAISERQRMIDHLELQTRKIEENAKFYHDVLGLLGYQQKIDGSSKGFGAGGALDLFLVDGDPSSNVHYAFAAASRSIVDQAWEAGREAGHTVHRAPALAPHVHPNYYAGYLRDPDGRLVELVCQKPE